MGSNGRKSNRPIHQGNLGEDWQHHLEELGLLWSLNDEQYHLRNTFPAMAEVLDACAAHVDPEVVERTRRENEDRVRRAKEANDRATKSNRLRKETLKWKKIDREIG